MRIKQYFDNLGKIKDSVTSIMIILFITKILGFLKVRIFAQLFGASAELDLFWAAFTIPDTIFNVLIAGSINAAIIPMFSNKLHSEGKGDLNEFFNKISIIYIAVITALSVIMLLFAQPIAQALISSSLLKTFLGLNSVVDIAKQNELAVLIRIMMISPIVLGVSNFLTAYLQTHKKFFSTSIAPLFYNLITIVGSVVFIKYMHLGLNALAWSIVLSSVAHMLVQLPEFLQYYTFKESHLRRSILKLFSKDTFQLLGLAFPRILGLLGEYVNVMFNTMLSFTLNTGAAVGGALSAYRFATSLYLFPVHIIVGSITQAALPSLSEYHAKNDQESFKKTFNNSLQQMIFLLLPITAVILILRLPIVRLAYGVGQFDWWDTVITSWCLAMLSLSIVPQAISGIVFRAFYAIHETWMPLIATFVGVVLNVILGYLLTNFFSHYFDWRPILNQIYSQITMAKGGEAISVLWSLIQDSFTWSLNRANSEASVGGLALAFSITFVIEMILLLVLFNKKTKILSWKETVVPVLKKLFLATIAGFAMYFVYKLSDFGLDTTRTLNVVFLTLFTTIYGFVIYIIGSRVMNIPEYFYLQSKFVSLIAPVLERIKMRLFKNAKR